MMEDTEIEFDILEEDLGLIVAEGLVRDLDALLEDLLILHGAAFIRQLKDITSHPSFYPVQDEPDIFITGGESGEDYENLLNAARKAVEHAYRVFILPNPKGIRTADFIFERKGVYKMFDLKTIIGKASVSNRLLDSIGQTNRVLLNMSVDYNPVALARNIKTYYEKNPQAIEVLIFKGRKIISVLREDTESRAFHKIFIAKYIK